MLSIGPTKAANTRRLLLAAATGKSMSGPRWDRLAPLTTMPWAKASSPRSSASSRHGKKSPRRRRRRLPASVTLKPSIARSAERSQIPTPLRLNSKPRDSWADLNAKRDRRTRLAAEGPRSRRAIVDIGRGLMALEAYLPRSTMYVPMDVVARDSGAIVFDINKAPIPVVDRSAAVMRGVLEYVEHITGVLSQLRAFPNLLQPYLAQRPALETEIAARTRHVAAAANRAPVSRPSHVVWPRNHPRTPGSWWRAPVRGQADPGSAALGASVRRRGVDLSRVMQRSEGPR